MDDVYGTSPTTGTVLYSESEDITNILNQLLQSSSSSLSPFSSGPSSNSFAALKAKYAHLLPCPPTPQPQHHTTSFSDAANVSGLFGRSESRTELEPSSAAGSFGFGITESRGGFFGAGVKDGTENAFSDANTSLKGRRISPENDLGDSCESEDPEASDVPSNSDQPPRISSKRSRAAEVHNLSEKRRRSRINEKLKALQNLIPNSNKTDKASMLDEVIEYLKQLQLQVQMLSMRNGLSLHPMCLAGVLQPMQFPLPQTGLGFNEKVIKNPNPGIGISTFSGHEETMIQSPYHLSDTRTTLNQPVILPSVANIPTSEASLGFEQLARPHFRPVNLTPTEL